MAMTKGEEVAFEYFKQLKKIPEIQENCENYVPLSKMIDEAIMDERAKAIIEYQKNILME